jgi:glucose uptake protein
MARAGENGLGPYSIGFIFAVGVFFSTFVFNLFFMNLPVKGEPADVTDYFRIRIRRHLTGILGGILWYAGGIAYFIGGRVEGAARVAPSASYALGQGATVVSILCGLLIWKEFAGADFTVKTWLGLMLVLFVLGIGLVSSAALVPAS